MNLTNWTKEMTFAEYKEYFKSHLLLIILVFMNFEICHFIRIIK